MIMAMLSPPTPPETCPTVRIRAAGSFDPRHHAEHYQEKRAGKTEQHDANDNQPPVPLPHDKLAPVPSVDEHNPTQRIVPSTFIWVQSMSKDSGLG
jgi:hypothetical protein